MENENILNSSKELGVLIKKTDIYKNYLFFKEIVKADPILLENIRILKSEQARLEFKKMQGEEISVEDESYVNNLYSQVVTTENGNNFLNYEKELLKLISDVYEKISTEIDMDFSFYN